MIHMNLEITAVCGILSREILYQNIMPEFLENDGLANLAHHFIHCIAYISKEGR